MRKVTHSLKSPSNAYRGVDVIPSNASKKSLLLYAYEMLMSLCIHLQHYDGSNEVIITYPKIVLNIYFINVFYQMLFMLALRSFLFISATYCSQTFYTHLKMYVNIRLPLHVGALIIVHHNKHMYPNHMTHGCDVVTAMQPYCIATHCPSWLHMPKSEVLH